MSTTSASANAPIGGFNYYKMTVGFWFKPDETTMGGSTRNIFTITNQGGSTNRLSFTRMSAGVYKVTVYTTDWTTSTGDISKSQLDFS